MGFWLCLSVYIIYMGCKYGAFIISHSVNGATTTAEAFDDKKMVTMASTVIADPVVVAQLGNILAVAPFPFQIFVPPLLPSPPPPPLHLILPLTQLLPSPSDSTGAVSSGFGRRGSRGRW